MTTRRALPDAVAFLLGEREGRCGCAGQCGDTHDGGRCGVDELGCLSVAPADRTIPIEWAPTVPVEDLLVWCRPCRASAESAARHDRVDRKLDVDLVKDSDTTTAQRPQLNWWLQGVLADFYAARDQWDTDCEAYSKCYPTEAAEYEQLNPRPQLRDFLRDRAHTGGDAAAQAATGVALADAIGRAERAVIAVRQRQAVDRNPDWDADLGLAGQSLADVDRTCRTPAGLGW